MLLVASDSDADYLLDDDQAEWELLQSQDVDYASIHACSEYLSDCKQLLICANILLALLLGCLCCAIFSRYVRS